MNAPSRPRGYRFSLTMLFVAAILLLLLPLFARGAEVERVRVAAAKTRAALTVQAVLPDTPPNVVLPNAPKPSPRGMSLEITGEPVAEVDTAEKLDLSLHTTSDCSPCETMKRAVMQDARLNVTLAPLNQVPRGVPLTTFPFITFRDDANQLRYNGTVRTADEVVRLIERTRAGRMTRRLTAVELKTFARGYSGPPVGVFGMTVRQHLLSATHGFADEQLTGLNESELLAVHAGHHHGQILPSEQTVAVGSRRDRLEPSAPSAPAGAIQGREQIAAGLAWWRSHVGAGSVSVEWTRNGAQLLPLLRRGTWTPQAIYGTSGTFAFTLTGATTNALPVDQASLDYRLADGKLRLRGETSIDARLIGIDTTGPHAVGEAQPMSLVDPMTILSVASMVWGLLHPQADLTLPGAMSATAVMRGEELVVTFRDAPSLRLVMLFTFQLRVESIAISETKVVLSFSGSRWIKSRSFEVQ